MPAMKELVKGTDRYRHYINGQWVDSTIKEWIDVEKSASLAGMSAGLATILAVAGFVGG